MIKRFSWILLAAGMMISSVMSVKAETITGVGWWNSANQSSQDYVLTGDDSITAIVETNGDLAPIFCVEITDGQNYFTTTSQGDAWWFGSSAEAGSGVTKGEVDSNGASGDQTYYVTVTRSGNRINIQYFNKTTCTVLWQELSGTSNVDLGETINVHVLAQVGTFDVSWEGPEDLSFLPLSNGYDYQVLEDGTVKILSYNEEITDYGSLEIPTTIDGKNVSALGKQAYNNGGNVQTILVHEGIQQIDKGAFLECYNLTIRGTRNTVAESYALENGICFEAVTVTDKTYEEIKTYTEGNTEFEYMILADDTVRITMCKSDEEIIRIPEMIEGKLVTELSDVWPYVWENDSDLERTLVIPKGVSFIECETVFEKWFTVGEVIISEENTAFKVVDGILYSENGKKIYYSWLKEETHIEILDSVVMIADSVFKNHNKMETITLPDNLRIIGYSAFCNCISLKSVDLPENMYEIYPYAFGNCTSLESVTFPEGLKYIDGSAFEYCSSIKEIELPDSLRIVDIGVFTNCTGLTKVKLPENMTYIYDTSFEYCAQLTEVILAERNGQYKIIDNALYTATGAELIMYWGSESTFTVPDGVTDIGEAFKGRQSIEKVIFPDSLQKIESSAFMNCSNLQEVVLSEGITEIDTYAFFDCINLKKVELPISLAVVRGAAFDGCEALVFYVWEGSYAEQYAKENGFEYELKSEPVAVNISASSSNVQNGDKVTFIAAASGGSGDYTYKFLVYNKSTETWANLTSSYITNNTFTWTAGSSGEREFYVEVKDSEGTVVRSEAVNVNVADKPLAITGTVSASSVIRGTKVTLTGVATGGSGSYTYSYLVYNKTTGVWARLTPSFSNSNTFTWTAGSTGVRNFYIEVKDSNGTVVRSQAVNVTVDTSELKIIGQSSVNAVEKGGKITLTATASGGSGKYTYSYLVYNKTTGVWARLTPSFVASNTFTWTAGSTGERVFYVEVKDSDGNVVRSEPICVNVTESKLAVTAKVSESGVTAGSKVTISGEAAGGEGSYTYSYLVYNVTTNTWARLTSTFTSSKSFTWIAGSAGNRKFYVEVKDGTGKVVRSGEVNVVVK